MVKVVLTKDVENLGKAGEVKDVSPGYMRNFLVPKKLAEPATESTLHALEARRASMLKAQEKARAAAASLAERLNATVITFQVRVGEQHRLYGSITSKDIADELARTANLAIDRRDIELEEPLKTLGTFTVPVKLHTDVRGSIHVVLQEAPSA